MNRKTVVMVFVVVGLVSGAAAANETVSIESPSSVGGEVSVGSGVQVLDNLTVNFSAVNGSSATFEMAASGKFQGIFADNSFRITPNNTKQVEVFTDVGPKTDFGWYNGTVSVSGAGVSDNVSVSVRVVDRISPQLSSIQVNSVEATRNQTFSVDASDNLGVEKVRGSVYYSEVVNETTGERENRSVQNMSFLLASGETYEGVFSESGNIGRHWIKISAVDESGNFANTTRKFQVNGLDSMSVLTTNFVFDTIRVKSETRQDIVRSRLDGRTVKFTLENLSYGGNASVQIGVLPPGGSSPEILSKGENRSFTEKGTYQLVMLHTGEDESKGTHRVTGDVKVFKPERHVSPRSVGVSFSGTVKNLDKPPETCTRVAEFQACIGYSFDSVKSLFEGNFTENAETGNSSVDYAWKISRVPISQVEGSDEWQDATSFTMGQYNSSLQNAIQEKEEAMNKKNGAELQRNLIGIIALIITSWSLVMRRDRDHYVFKGVPESSYDKTFGSIKEFKRWKNE